jgi:hypothetical protein
MTTRGHVLIAVLLAGLPGAVPQLTVAYEPRGAMQSQRVPLTYKAEVLTVKVRALTDLPGFIQKINPSAVSAVVFSLQISGDLSACPNCIMAQVEQSAFSISYKLSDQTRTVPCAALEAGGSWVMGLNEQPGSVLVRLAAGTGIAADPVQAVFLLSETPSELVLYRNRANGESQELKSVNLTAIK